MQLVLQQYPNHHQLLDPMCCINIFQESLHLMKDHSPNECHHWYNLLKLSLIKKERGQLTFLTSNTHYIITGTVECTVYLFTTVIDTSLISFTAGVVIHNSSITISIKGVSVHSRFYY